LRIFSSADEDLYDNISKSEYDVFIQPNANLNKSTMNLVNSTLVFEKIDIVNKQLLIMIDLGLRDSAHKWQKIKITALESLRQTGTT